MKWSKEEWIKYTGFSAPFAKWVVDGWKKTSIENGWDKIAEEVRNNIKKKIKR